ncbi:MAG: tetratricopeptide repeat protein [Acidobacteriota bacterium]|nr:tetratricopeptide repeat protein [Acidobacteriota bacterium]
MNPPTDWVSALAILAAGLILGLIVFLASKRLKSSAVNKRRELEARRDALVQQLREIDDDVADDERAWLETETAEVLRALDELPAGPAIADAPAPNRRPALVGFAWGIACAILAGSIIYYGSTFTRERDTPAPQQQAQTPMSSDAKQLEEAVRTDPNNPDHRIALAKMYFGQNDLMAAFEQTKAVLAQNPNEPRALTYNAVVRMSMGEIDQARTMLEQATKTDPTLLDAWVALCSVHLQRGDEAAASAAIEAAIAQHPEEQQRLHEVFADLKKKGKPGAAHPGTQTAAASSMPPDHPPMPGMESSMPAAVPAMTSSAPPAKPIRITLSLDPSATVKSGVVYVIARGGEAGHPVAVRRIDAAAFPLSLELGSADSMMGASLPPNVRIEARLDSDGDAGTKDPSDLNAAIDGVNAGSAVTLKLARK